MPNRSFFWFFLPAGLAMILFIGLPIISTGIQSFYAQHDQILVKVKKCDPFGCKESVVVDQEATSKIRDEKPLGKFNGFGTYIDRNHLAVEQISEFWVLSRPGIWDVVLSGEPVIVAQVFQNIVPVHVAGGRSF